MSTSVSHFARLVRVELEDLLDDIKCRISRNDARFEREEITSYVHMENNALLKHELESIGRFGSIVDGIDPSNYKDTAAYEDQFLARAGALTGDSDDPGAVFVLLKRKLDKVRAYISSGELEPES
ncbi:MAG: hypothetical protein JXM71_08825 [Spirochaetales bacterium]|nr:hypothetical protein [Spirochaetales bacterium]